MNLACINDSRTSGRERGRSDRGRLATLAASVLVASLAAATAPAAEAQVTPHADQAPDPAPASSAVVATVKPIPFGDGLTFKPLVDLRVRYENVHQDGVTKNANAVTARLRAGAEVATASGFAALVEAEGTLPIDADYNSATNGKTLFAAVSDPANVELNRAQLQYRGLKGWTFTAGRQRITVDDQRFVGSSPWRQNEQTFDAVRVQAKAIGPFVADVAYAWSDRTIYGITAQKLPVTSPNRQAIGGDNVFASAGVKLGPVLAKGFAYLIDQDELSRRQFSSQTYGARATASVPVGPLKLNLVGSYARQSDYASNPNRYAASYWTAEGATTIAGFGGTVGYELLGADGGGGTGTAFQTPLASLHKFNGFADQFLTTPANGLTDLYASLGRDFPGVEALPGLTASVSYHRFRSDRLDLHYGDEWDAQVGFKLRGVGVLAKYATYDADRFATDTRKLWLELDWTI